MEKFRSRRHLAFYIAIIVGLLAGAAAAVMQPGLGVAIGVNAFFLIYLVLTWRALRKLTPDFLRKHAADEDAPAPFILFVMLAAVIVSAVSLFLVLAGNTGHTTLQLGLGIISVVLGWFAVHTMWAMHYAFEYYDVPAASGKSGDVEGGLDFPGTDKPDGVAFLYFAYVIGMTAQTSDTEVCSNAMRKLVIIHSVFSFFFNTVLVAAAVNIVVALAR